MKQYSNKSGVTLRASLIAGVSLGAILFGAIPTVSANDGINDFNIKAGDLKTALNVYIDQSGRQLIYRDDQVQGFATSGTTGTLTNENALLQVLAGSNLVVREDSSGAVLIADGGSGFEAISFTSDSERESMLGSYEEDDSSEETAVFEEIVTIGSRSNKARTISDSPVPIDVISAGDLDAMGGTVDLTDNLKNLIPSYTATPATGDASAFVRPTSLRGTAPDQTLVLVDGKRRHRSAVVQFFAPAAGNGAQGVDIGMIPSIALKRVEVLRDGAAAQYGSDAIAGVMNFVTKDSSEGGTYTMQYGQHYQGEANYKIGLNQGFALGDKGFLNVSMEYSDNAALSRGLQRPDAQALIDSGVQGVGADAPFGDAPLVQTWGRPKTNALRFFVNSGIEISDNATLYARMGYADTFGRYRFFYRRPGDEDAAALQSVIDQGYTGSLAQTGYTPFLDGNQKDYSLVTGLKGELSGGTYYDFSFGYGKNKLSLFLNNEINPGLGLTADFKIPQMNFVMGGYEQEELSLNADFSTPISDSINLAYGAEWRRETFTANAGEKNSYIDANGLEGGGVDGRISPSDAGKFSRNNIAAYIDIEQDVTDKFMLQYAVRYENFSDFGGTINGKVAGRYNISDSVALRGAVSTGFKAPTPGQANIKATISTFDGATGNLILEGLISATDPKAIAAGGKKLTEEKSFNLSFGMSADISDNTTMTVDFYKISVDNRIYRSGDITAADGSSISFYTNAMDVNYTGVDLVITSRQEWASNVSTDFSLAYNYNKINVVKQKLVNGIKPVSDATVEDIENNYPNNRFTLTANTLMGDKWNLLLRANYYGKHYDERGRINGVDGKPPTAQIGSVVYLDLEIGYQVTDNFRIKAGGSNILNNFVDRIGPPNANRLSVGLQYPRRSAANYEGGSWYLGANYSF
ncbi:TonB-dependent receptor [hydrothermal vent metagenome]|uniref:TonB-dependent receptor n=1 Tax=hydrothermal vent metagenome TaxID=652676 RepID=A0A3B0S3Y3_9ZZZZ